MKMGSKKMMSVILESVQFVMLSLGLDLNENALWAVGRLEDERKCDRGRVRRMCHWVASNVDTF